MLAYLAHALARPIVRGWLIASSASWRRLPHPPGRALVHAAGSNPDRVLLIGSGLVAGYGGISHDLGFAGAFARQLGAHTHRGADVEIIADPDLTVATLPDVLSDLRTSRFDAIVVSVGPRETLQLMPSRRWRRLLHEALVALTDNAPRGLRVFLLGVPPIAAFEGERTRASAVLATLLSRQERRINAQTARCCARFDGVEFVPFPPRPAGQTFRFDRPTYDTWARQLAPAIADSLESSIEVRDDDRDSGVDERRRVAALHETGILDSSAEEEFDRIVATARQLFGTSGAALNFIDEDRQWTKAATGIDQHDVPRDDALCSLAIESADVFVSTDLRSDERVAGMSWAGRSTIRFYAGHPIETPDGSRVGTLCIVDDNPREFGDSDAALLRQLALQAQGLLWRRRSGLPPAAPR